MTTSLPLNWLPHPDARGIVTSALGEEHGRKVLRDALLDGQIGVRTGGRVLTEEGVHIAMGKHAGGFVELPDDDYELRRKDVEDLIQKLKPNPTSLKNFAWENEQAARERLGGNSTKIKVAQQIARMWEAHTGDSVIPETIARHLRDMRGARSASTQ